MNNILSNIDSFLGNSFNFLTSDWYTTGSSLSMATNPSTSNQKQPQGVSEWLILGLAIATAYLVLR